MLMFFKVWCKKSNKFIGDIHIVEFSQSYSLINFVKSLGDLTINDVYLLIVYRHVLNILGKNQYICGGRLAKDETMLMCSDFWCQYVMINLMKAFEKELEKKRIYLYFDVYININQKNKIEDSKLENQQFVCRNIV